jgi:acetyl esterase
MSKLVTTTDSVVRGRDGDNPIRTYEPTAASGQTPFVWVHGGGFVLGGLEQVESDAPARYLAARGRRVVTLDYRLAPNPGLFKNPQLGAAPGRFPEAHYDVLDVAEFLRARSGTVSIGGASAGANLAAGALLSLRDQALPLPRSAVLAYGSFHSTLPENVAVESGLKVRWRWLRRTNGLLGTTPRFRDDDYGGLVG